MTDLAIWLERNTDALIAIASEALSENALLQSQVVQAVETFYDALLQSARTYDLNPLCAVLSDWVNARSAPTERDTSSLMPALAQLKAITGDQIYRLANGDAGALYYVADSIFTEALVFLAAVEAEDLLTTARQQLDQAENEIANIARSKTDFISIAAHELKTPLTVIDGYSGILRQIGATEQDDSLAVIADGIDNGARRLREIIEDLVDVTMIDLRLLDLNLQPTFLHQIVDAAERSVRAFTSQRRQQLIIERETIPTAPLLADPERLLQVLNKLMVNAIKYTPDEGRIVLSGRMLPGFFELIIADTGVGIDPQRLDSIFDAFSSSADVSRHSSGKVKFQGGGPGLGLPIARGIIEAHGGSIWVESSGYNERTCPGTAFHVMLPVREAALEQVYR